MSGASFCDPSSILTAVGGFFDTLLLRLTYVSPCVSARSIHIPKVNPLIETMVMVNTIDATLTIGVGAELNQLDRQVYDVVQPHSSRSFPSTVPCNKSMEILLERW